MASESKKAQVLLQLLAWCQAHDTLVFHNDQVKEIAREVGFGNPFDVTKLGNLDLLPQELRDLDLAVIHLGRGNHAFVKGTRHVYHAFEPITERQDWLYQKSLLNNYNTSESNTLSVANNQRILHHFAFGQDREFDDIDVTKRPKTYFPHRTKKQLAYEVNGHLVGDLLQIEVDLTIEFQGTVAVFEGKNGKPTSFNIFQLYHPFLYYHLANENDSSLNSGIKEIICIYVIRQTEKIALWAYTFDQPLDPTSIRFLRSKSYRLVQQ